MISARFKPAEDITAYELAQIVVRLAPNDRGICRFFFGDEKWDGLSPELKRHFKVDRDGHDEAA